MRIDERNEQMKICRGTKRGKNAKQMCGMKDRKTVSQISITKKYHKSDGADLLMEKRRTSQRRYSWSVVRSTSQRRWSRNVVGSTSQRRCGEEHISEEVEEEQEERSGEHVSEEEEEKCGGKEGEKQREAAE